MMGKGHFLCSDFHGAFPFWTSEKGAGQEPGSTTCGFNEAVTYFSSESSSTLDPMAERARELYTVLHGRFD